MTCAGLAPEPELSEGKRFYSQVAEERLAFDQAAKLDRLKYTVEQAKNAPIYRDRLGGVSISSLDDLVALSRLGLPNIRGVIVGRALYEGRFTVADAVATLAAAAP